MRFGFALPQVGSAVGPETLVTVAKRAEDLGFDSLWVLDRILWPVNPRAPYPIADDTRHPVWRTTKSRIWHRMVTGRIRGRRRDVARARQTRRRADPGPKKNLDDRSGRISGEILSDPKIRHRSEARAETSSPDLHGGL